MSYVRYCGARVSSAILTCISWGMQVCHGLRNPLHAAMGLLEVLRSDDGIMGALRMLPSATAARCGVDLETLDTELRAMRAVLNAVVDSQLLEAGEATVNLGPTDLQAIVRDLCHYHRTALNDSVDLLVAVAANVPQIHSDGERIGQVRYVRFERRMVHLFLRVCGDAMPSLLLC